MSFKLVQSFFDSENCSLSQQASNTVTFVGVFLAAARPRQMHRLYQIQRSAGPDSWKSNK